MKTHRINVARDNGKRNRYAIETKIAWEYYFHIELDTRFTDKRAMEVAADIQKRFPAEEGFKVSMTEWTVPVETDMAISSRDTAEENHQRVEELLFKRYNKAP